MEKSHYQQVEQVNMLEKEYDKKACRYQPCATVSLQEN